ncbi:hypothetical protein ACO1O0_003279 [Amphichorda felina]
MSSIGPQLPPHLSKRKRTPDADRGSHPPKNQRTQSPVANQNEIGLDDSDSDGYGPKPIAGPSMPPQNKDEIDIASDSDSDVGPAPPKPTSAGPAPAPAPAPAPVPQPHPPPPAADIDDSSSSDDDDYGPSLPSASISRPQIGPSLPPSAAEDDAPQRDSWMLAPPTGGTFTERDPTKIRARKFASGKPGAGAAPAGSRQPSSIWTETPEEKLRRLKDSVLGRTGGDGEDRDGGAGSSRSAKSKEAEERDRKIAANIEASRGKSMYEEHNQKRRERGLDKEEEDDPSKRGFDREKDMALGGRLGAAQRKELMNKSANFSGKFQKGSYL